MIYTFRVTNQQKPTNMKAELSKQNQTRKNPTGTFFGKNLKNNFFSKDTEENHSFFSSSSPKNLKNNYHFFNKNSHDKNIEHNAYDSDSGNYEKESLTGNISEIHTPHGSELNKETEIINEKAFDKIEPRNYNAIRNFYSYRNRYNNESCEDCDPVDTSITIGSFNQLENLNAPPFGMVNFKIDYSNIDYEYKDSKYIIKGKLNVNCPWGTDCGGHTDVPSATDSVVTATNYLQIKRDLTPIHDSPYISPRFKYYSKKLSEKHEKFHGTDFYSWVKSSALPILIDYLEGSRISKGETADDEIEYLMESAKNKIKNEITRWYRGDGTSYYSYAAEKRAYADGKDHYQQLADDVEKHGKKQKELEEIIIGKTRIFD